MSEFCPFCGYTLSKDGIIEQGPARWDPRGAFHYAGQYVHLTTQQHILVGSLLSANGRVAPKDTLLMRLGTDADQRIVDVLICGIRRKLRAFGGGHHIVTAWGRGFYWCDAAPAEAA